MKLKYNIPYDIDSPERTIFHGKIIENNRFLRKIYLDWYRTLKRYAPIELDGHLVELGSGGGFLKELLPSVITSDILPLPDVDRQFSALQMPFADGSIAALLMINTFHHLPDSEAFLTEAFRVLEPGGRIVMIEPANSWWGRIIYQNFHHEDFDPGGTWLIEQDGPLSDANGALPWIVFERDREIFREKFAGFQVCRISYQQPISYLLSGGFSYRSLLPGNAYPVVKGVDRLLSSLSKGLSLFMLIVVEKHLDNQIKAQ